MKPFEEEHITIELDPESGTAKYDEAKKSPQFWINSWRLAEDIMRPVNPLGAEISKKMRNKTTDSAANHSEPTTEKILRKALNTKPDKEVNERLNFGFFTHNFADENNDPDGHNMSLNRINPDAIIEQFKSRNPDDWPNLLLNCNHARVGDTLSVSGIMEGFHTLASDCFRDKDGRARELNLIMNHDERTPEDEGPRSVRKSKPSIILSGVFNNHNAFGNAATLLYRLRHLDAVYKIENRGDITSQREREALYCGEGFASMAPNSVMLAKLMLKLIAQNPNDITLPNKAMFEQYGKYIDDKIYAGDMTQFLMNSEASPPPKAIKLRPDAAQILQHILPEGYSKGGQIISDAVRFLMLDLQRPLDLSREDAPSLFTINDKKLEQTDVSNLIFNLGILNVNPGCTPFNQYEEKMGMRRLIIASTRDAIIGHLLKRPIMDELRSRKPDGTQGFYEITPKEKLQDLGHGFLDALGRSDRHGGIEDRGYVADPEQLETDTDEKRKLAHEVRSRLRVIHAACYDALGVSDVKELNDHSFALEFSRGASEKGIQTISQKLQELIMPRLGGAKVETLQNGRCSLMLPPSEQKPSRFYTPPTWKAKLAEGLEKLADPKRHNGGPELFVGDHVYHALGTEPPQVENARA